MYITSIQSARAYRLVAIRPTENQDEQKIPKELTSDKEPVENQNKYLCM